MSPDPSAHKSEEAPGRAPRENNHRSQRSAAGAGWQASRRGLVTLHAEEPQLLRIPVNEAAERAVLGAVLADADCYPRAVAHVNATDFYSDQNRLVFDAFRQLAGDNSSIDLLTTTDQLERSGTLAAAGGVAYVASLAEGLPDTPNIEYYCAIVRERAVRRELLHLGQELTRDAADLTSPVGDLIAATIATLTGLTARLGGNTFPDPNGDLPGLDRTDLWRATRNAEAALAAFDCPQTRERVRRCREEVARRRKGGHDD